MLQVKSGGVAYSSAFFFFSRLFQASSLRLHHCKIRIYVFINSYKYMDQCKHIFIWIYKYIPVYVHSNMYFVRRWLECSLPRSLDNFSRSSPVYILTQADDDPLIAIVNLIAWFSKGKSSSFRLRIYMIFIHLQWHSNMLYVYAYVLALPRQNPWAYG